MPKIPEPSVVDIEIRKRMEEGMLTKTGRDIRGNDEEYQALLRLARLAGVDPLTSTYLEIDRAVQDTFERWRARAVAFRQIKARVQGWCEHCPLYGTCSVCGSVHPSRGEL